MRQHGVAVRLAAKSRGAATGTQHQAFLPSLRDFHDCSFSVGLHARLNAVTALRLRQTCATSKFEKDEKQETNGLVTNPWEVKRINDSGH